MSKELSEDERLTATRWVYTASQCEHLHKTHSQLATLFRLNEESTGEGKREIESVIGNRWAGENSSALSVLKGLVWRWITENSNCEVIMSVNRFCVNNMCARVFLGGSPFIAETWQMWPCHDLASPCKTWWVIHKDAILQKLMCVTY